MASGLHPGFAYAGHAKKKLSDAQIQRLAKAFGLPAKGMQQITKGESSGYADIQQHDPGDGMVGYGLIQATPNAWGAGSAARKYLDKLGGVSAMKDPVKSMQMARFLYKSAGNSFKPWYGTKFLTDRSGEGKLGPVRPELLKGLENLSADLGPSAGGGGGTPGTPAKPGKVSATYNGSVTPAQAQPSMQQAIIQTLGAHTSGGLPDFRKSRLKQAKFLFDSGAATQLSPVQTTGDMVVTRTPGTPAKPGTPADTAAGGGAAGSLGKISIFNGNPGRLKAPVRAFAKEVAGVAGRTLRIDSGATHSKFTVNGNVSDHWSGNATDIPASGKQLTKLGQDALVAAGWSRARASKTQGGLFNVVGKDGKRHQIIFNTMEGGNHYTHLHISSK